MKLLVSEFHTMLLKNHAEEHLQLKASIFAILIVASSDLVAWLSIFNSVCGRGQVMDHAEPDSHSELIKRTSFETVLCFLRDSKCSTHAMFPLGSSVGSGLELSDSFSNTWWSIDQILCYRELCFQRLFWLRLPQLVFHGSAVSLTILIYVANSRALTYVRKWSSGWEVTPPWCDTVTRTRSLWHS